MKDHAAAVLRPSRIAERAAGPGGASCELNPTVGPAANVADAILRHPPRRPLFAGPRGDRPPLPGLDVDSGDLRRPPQPPGRDDVVDLGEFDFVDDQRLADG